VVLETVRKIRACRTPALGCHGCWSIRERLHRDPSRRRILPIGLMLPHAVTVSKAHQSAVAAV
jgi:hypothetical protein